MVVCAKSILLPHFKLKINSFVPNSAKLWIGLISFSILWNEKLNEHWTTIAASQLLVQNHMNEPPQSHDQRPLIGTGTTSGTRTMPAGTTLSRLLETARSVDGPSHVPTSLSFQGNQGFDSRRGSSTVYSIMTQDDSFATGRTPYKPSSTTTVPSSVNSTDRGRTYHINVDGSGDYTSGIYNMLGVADAAGIHSSTASTQVERRSSHDSTVAFPSSFKSTNRGWEKNEVVDGNYAISAPGGDQLDGTGDSSTWAQLKQIDRLEEDLQMLKRRMQG